MAGTAARPIPGTAATAWATAASVAAVAEANLLELTSGRGTTLASVVVYVKATMPVAAAFSSAMRSMSINHATYG